VPSDWTKGLARQQVSVEVSTEHFRILKAPIMFEAASVFLKEEQISNLALPAPDRSNGVVPNGLHGSHSFIVLREHRDNEDGFLISHR
jgi:hypothetical protein